MTSENNLLNRLTDIISWLVGSWPGIMLHATWFGVWIYLDLPIENLTLAVSLEAIFIGIFLLMAADKTEKAREEKSDREREKDRTKLHDDVNLSEKQLKLMKSLQKEFQHLKSSIERIEEKI